MTYNFDPEGWYERQRTLLDAEHAAGRLDEAALAARLEDLDRRYEEMLSRLDGTYSIPPARDGQ